MSHLIHSDFVFKSLSLTVFNQSAAALAVLSRAPSLNGDWRFAAQPLARRTWCRPNHRCGCSLPKHFHRDLPVYVSRIEGTNLGQGIVDVVEWTSKDMTLIPEDTAVEGF